MDLHFGKYSKYCQDLDINWEEISVYVVSIWDNDSSDLR